MALLYNVKKLILARFFSRGVLLIKGTITIYILRGKELRGFPIFNSSKEDSIRE